MYIIIIIITDTYGSTVASYSYDVDGLRQTKTVGGVEHRYVWQGSKLVSEYWGGKELEFFYDESGMPYAFSYKSSSNATPVFYYYVTNLQGDVVKIITASGTVVANYSYNAWGKLLSSSGTMASVNPIRYRGYYFDAESGLYYLQSRYYDPEIGRFVNADAFTSTGQGLIGCNMFAYCKNNPVMGSDPTGEFVNTITGAIIGGLIGGFSSMLQGNSFAEGAVHGVITGAVSGLAADVALATGGAAMIVIATFAGGGVAAVSTLIDQKRSGREIDVGEIAVDALVGSATTLLTVYSGGVSPTKLGGNVFKNMVKNTKSVINANTTKVFKGKVVMKNAKAVSKIRAGNIARAFGETAAISSGGWINSLGWRSVV